MGISPAGDKQCSVPGATAWCASILERAGVPAPEARITAEILVRTDARGIRTHGLMRLRSYLEKLLSGEVSRAAEISVESRDSFGIVEARGALGQVAGSFAIDHAVEATRSRPLAALTVRDTGHLGALGVLALRAAESGRIALVFQATPPTVAMPGALGPMLGNNPFALAAPRPDGPPIVVDMACSVAARGNILLAARTGERLPEGWALDEHGDPTTDADAALRGMLLPFGGHKGLGVSIIVELLAGSLSGRPFEAHLNKDGRIGVAAGHVNAFVLLLNPDEIAGRAAYEAHVSAWTSHFKSGGAGARLPGERAHQAETLAMKDGISLRPDTAEDLTRLGREHGLPFPER